MHEMNDSTCKGCGKKILWGVTPEGKRIPLDPSAPLYGVNQITENGPVVVLLPAADRKVQGPWVSHFSTCAKADLFSASKEGMGRDLIVMPPELLEALKECVCELGSAGRYDSRACRAACQIILKADGRA